MRFALAGSGGRVGGVEIEYARGGRRQSVMFLDLFAAFAVARGGVTLNRDLRAHPVFVIDDAAIAHFVLVATRPVVFVNDSPEEAVTANLLHARLEAGRIDLRGEVIVYVELERGRPRGRRQQESEEQ